jgi:hypothetical protein
VCIEVESKPGNLVDLATFVSSGAIALPHTEHSPFIAISARTLSLRLADQEMDPGAPTPMIIEHVTCNGERLRMYLNRHKDGVVALGECVGILIGHTMGDYAGSFSHIVLLVADRGTCYERIGSLCLLVTPPQEQSSEHAADKAAGRPVQAYYEDIPESSWVQRKLRIG